ncbi:ATP-dependent helicase HepA [Enhygromyxa salina]|uniref:ATP-dependent helicase HepA n=1 Tax=Enhygromyxa salina TaxID=215803 RepID=A0A2S9XEK1_9BACT|nr:DEAD/DEAH box helicase [Enhygromyxa salina]PRP91296.1 ATP-dependent helicase HepA [Enhygromyxa salina]
MEDYLQTVRDGCSPAQWTRAVKAARAGKVHGLRIRGDELDFRVESLPGLPAQTVTLEPTADDWDCDCDARTEACEHVAAAAIALAEARKRGLSMPGEDRGPVAHIGYRLRSRRGPLKLRRVLTSEAGEVLMPASLAKLERGKVKDAPAFTADKADRAFEQRFGPAVKAKIPPGLMADVLDYLTRVVDVTLDGRPVEIGKPSAGLRLRVSETKTGEFLARVEQDPEINELFENGAFRRSRTIHAIGPHGLAASRFEALRKGQLFNDREVGTLVGQLLPEVRKALPVTIDTPRLPGSVKMRPRIQLTTVREGDALQILPTIVYGDPPIARADGDRLTLLDRPGKKGARELPVRDLRVEKLLRARLRERFDLTPGVRKNLGATEAIELGRVIEQDQAGIELAGDAHTEFFEAAPLEPTLILGKDGEFELYFMPAGASGPGAEAEGEPDEFGSLDDDVHPHDLRAALGRARRGMRRADAVAVVRAWSGGEEFAPLLGGGFGRIPADFMAKHGHLVADLLAAREATAAEKDGSGRRAAILDLAALAQALDQAPPPEFDRLAALVGNFERIPRAELPEDLSAELRDYQRRGVDWLSFLREVELGGLLADDMGLGKTIQTLCVLRSGVDGGVRRQNLVVSPTSVLHNWRVEIEKFRPGLRASVYHGPGRTLDADADVILTTYAILRLDIEKLGAREWDTAVLDESQAIKNPTSKVARAAYRIRAKFKIALTGTPVENHLEDLWSQFHFLQAGLLGGRTEFGDRYVKSIAVGDDDAAARLRRRIRPFVLRRLKSEVATELPPRTDVVLRCELNKDERRAYDAVRAATQEQVVERLSGGANVMQVLEALLRLRQAACHPALLPGGRGRAAQAQAKGELQSSSKLELLLETLDSVLDEGHKALVFSQWTSLLDLIEPVLRARDIAFNRLDGATRDRQTVVDTFQDPAGPPVMLLSLKAGGTGLNLTAADNVFLLDPWWNPAVEDQAADRAHRIGQDKPVIVHRLIASETVEERILALQDRKRQLAKTAVGDAAGAHAITREELLALLE